MRHDSQAQRLDLTALGREQAEQLFDRLVRRLDSATEPPALFGSPPRRAQQIAEIVARRWGAPGELLDGLREVDVGGPDGRGDSASWQLYESVLESWRQGQCERRFPRGEDLHELCARLDASLPQVARAAHGCAAVVVAHGANLRAALPGLAGVDDLGTDLDIGQFADLEVTATPTSTRVRLLARRAKSSS